MTRSPSRPDATSGFSLLEMLVVLAIISLVVGVSTSTLGTGRDRRLPRDVAKEIYALTTEARYRAMNMAESQTIRIDVGKRTLASPSTDAAVVIPPDWLLFLTVGRIRLSPGVAGEIVFLPDGTSTGAEIVLGADRTDGAVVRVNWLTGITEFDEYERERSE